uniref:Reverse transcriptase domain-containing protein n=1 Tax=Tanacetum cinerariifolium TaxID=118510 RepID=A0A699HUP2_TANCI|nr:reverse transcriptase domain-containing protein [Tanacetum cinerariifolium]
MNGVTDDALRLYLFPHSLTHHATAWFDRLPRNSINTFEQMAKMFLGKYFPPSMVTKLRNEITNFRQHPDESLFEAWERYKISIDRFPSHNMLPVTQIDTFYNELTLRHRDTINAAVCGTFMKRRPEECYDLIKNMTAYHNDWDTSVQRSESSSYITSSSDPKIVALKAEMAKINKNLMKVLQLNQQVKMNTASTSGSKTLPSNTITNPKEDLKGITTRSGNAYQGPTIPTTSSPPNVMERETEPNSKPSIPYPSRLHDQKLRDKANDQKVKFFKIFKDLDFNISFADALILMTKFGSTIKSLLTYQEKLFELARTLLNEHCSAVLLKKLPEKLGDLGKFLLSCNFRGMDECLALADLGASKNLMPLSVWNKLSLPKLSPKCMTLELANRSISHPIGVAKDVFVKTGRALIDVYEGELTLRVGKEAVTFNLDQTSRYSTNYDAMSVNRIYLINAAYEEYSQEVLGFFMSDNSTPSMKPIVSTSSLTFTPFGDSDFLLEESDAFLAIDDEPISSEIDDRYYDSKGDIILLKEFLNDDPSSPPLPPQELKVVEPTNEKSSIDEPLMVELKDLPPHLEYAFWKCVEAFQTLKRKLTEATILVAHGWDLPFELMCDASDFAIGAVLGQRKTKHFQPIHYARKTMTDAQAHYTRMEKELLAVVYAFEKFWPYLVLSKSIVYTDHSALKYLFNKQDAKPRLLRWVLLLKAFDIIIRNKKGAKNLAADHLSRLENPHQSVLDKKEISETFPLKYPMSSGDELMARKPLTFSRLAIIDPPRDIMTRTTLPKRFLTLVFIGPQSIVMPMTWLNLVTLVNVKERFRNEMKCFKIPSKFAKFLTFGASISWGHSCLYEGTSIYSWPSITCRNGLKRKRSPPTMPNGQVEVSNRGLKRIFESTVDENHASWSAKLDDALWAIRTTFKTPIGCTPYKLVYEKACHLPIELENKAYWALKHCNYDLLTVGDYNKVQLNELNELRDQAYENSLIYKEKTKRIHDSKIKDRVFNVGDRVLLFSSRLRIFPGKLKTRWSGPFTITQVFPYGTVDLS